MQRVYKRVKKWSAKIDTHNYEKILDITTSSLEDWQISLCGLSFTPGRGPVPEFYSFWCVNDTTRFPMNGDRIVLFEEIEHARDVFAMIPDEWKQNQPTAPEEVFETYDIPYVLDCIDEADIDRTGMIKNTLFALDDLVTNSGLEWPGVYKEPFRQYFRHMCFWNDYDGFLEETGIARRTLRNALLWAIGAVMASIVIYRGSSR